MSKGHLQQRQQKNAGKYFRAIAVCLAIELADGRFSIIDFQ
ncbi:MAG: hypothetical protein ACRC62_35060 [Microcoleus sp.]